MILRIAVVNEIPGLPYSEPYRAWADHIEICEHCQSAVDEDLRSGVARDSDVLCPAGAGLDRTMEAAVRGMHRDALLN